MLCQQLVHLKHVRTVNFEYQSQFVIAYYLSFVTRILEIVLSYVCPKLPDNLQQINTLIYQEIKIDIERKT